MWVCIYYIVNRWMLPWGMHGNRGHWDSYIFLISVEFLRDNITPGRGIEQISADYDTEITYRLKKPKKWRRYDHHDTAPSAAWRPPPPTARALMRLPRETGFCLSSNDDYVDDIINVQDRKQMTFCNMPAVKSLRERPYIWKTCKWSSRSSAISYRYCTCVLHLFNFYIIQKYGCITIRKNLANL